MIDRQEQTPGMPAAQYDKISMNPRFWKDWLKRFRRRMSQKPKGELMGMNTKD
jgi:hypothetical protein